MGACKTAVLLIGVVFHLCASSQPLSIAPSKNVQLESQVQEEEEKKNPPMSSFEKLVLSTETARQKAALAAALAQEYMNGERLVSNKYSEFRKMAENKNSSAEEYEAWSAELEEAASELLAEEEERLKLAVKVDKQASVLARFSRRSYKESTEGALNATYFESKAKRSRTLASDLFASAKLKHERAEDYIERAREEDKIAMELQNQAVQLSKLAEQHRTKATNTAAKAQELEDSAYEDEVSAVKHEKEAKIFERETEEAKTSDRESSLNAMEYLIRRTEKQGKVKRLQVGARNLHALAEVYSSEAGTLRGIAKRDQKDRDFYGEKAARAIELKVLYHKTIKGLLSLSRNYMDIFNQKVKTSNRVAAEKGYQYVVMKSQRFPKNNATREGA